MDPVSVVSAGKAAAGRRFAFYVSVQLTSVVVPGLVTVACLVAVVLNLQHPRNAGHALSGLAQSLHGSAGVLVDVSWLASAYVLGYVGRESGFRLLGLAERLSARNRAERAELYDELQRACGQAALRRCFRTHPLLEYLLGGDGAAAHARVLRRTGGGHRTDHVFEAYAYAKFWLRQHNPDLAPDTAEAEINILVSTLLPLALGTWALIAGVRLDAAAAVTVALVTALVMTVVFAQALRLRRAERWEALRNLVEDHEMCLAAARLPTSPLLADPGTEVQENGVA
jgi:hypothetical protein